MATLINASNDYVPKVSVLWGHEAYKVISGGTPVKGDWLVYLTERNRKSGAGWHGVENGFPVAYCSPKAVGSRTFGHYVPTKYNPITKKVRTLESFTPGLITTICHELAEMIVDPFVNLRSQFSNPDSLGRPWLMEPCDHVFGIYRASNIDGRPCVFPDVTSPAYYNLKGTGPFSLYSAVTAPFTLTVKGYGYYKDATGKLIKL